MKRHFKYKQTSLGETVISNDGRRVQVEMSTDNRGDTRITFGASYTLRVGTEDLETLIEMMQTAFEGHKQQAIDECNKDIQPSLPFGGEEDNYPLNDPRKW